MNRIIIPLDGSALSEQALGLAQVLARAYGATMELVHILEEPVVLDLLPSLLLPDRPAAEKYLRELAETLPDDIAKVWYAVRGNATEELLRLTSGATDTAVVMSTHGRGGLGRVMYGSVADKVLRGSTVPVALVRGTAARGDTPLRHLLVPLDGSELSESGLAAATDLAIASDAAMTLVRVVEPIWATTYGAFAEASILASPQILEVEEQLQAEARDYLDRIARDLRDKGLRVSWEVRAGRPADEIIRSAETTSSDMIVISTHGRGGIRRFALGSVTNEVLHRGSTPVFAIPPKAHASLAESVVVSTVSDAEVNDMLATGW